MKLAFYFRDANEKYATDYPAAVGPHMTNTDSGPFQDIIPAISLRENERGVHVGAGWDPHWHQPTDVYATFSDKDFLLALNAAQTTGGAVAELAVFDLSGRRIALVKGRAGSRLVWNGETGAGTRVPSGVYLYRLTVGDYQKTGRVLHVR